MKSKENTKMIKMKEKGAARIVDSDRSGYSARDCWMNFEDFYYSNTKTPYEGFTDEYIEAAFRLVISRCKRLQDIIIQSIYFFVEPQSVPDFLVYFSIIKWLSSSTGKKYQDELKGFDWNKAIKIMREGNVFILNDDFCIGLKKEELRLCNNFFEKKEEVIKMPSKEMPLFEYIENKPFEQIKEELEAEPLNIKVNEKDNLYLCKYNQIDSDFNYKMVRQCRGIILEKNTNKVIAFPFSKFFNIQEGHADKVDFINSSISSKIDGSLIKIFYYNNKWNIASNGTIDAKDAEATDLLTGRKFNFHDLFHESLKEQGLTFQELSEKMIPGFTYIFELVHPISRIVVKYEKPDLYLIGIRNNETMQEIDTFDDKEELVNKIISLGIKRPKTYKFTSKEEMLAASKILTADEEGYVVRDNNFCRVKCKSPLYLKMHHLKSNGELTLKHFVELIQTNEVEEFLSYWEIYKERVEEISNKINDYILCLQTDWENLFKKFGPEFKSRKDFAVIAKKTTNSAAMFNALDNYLKGQRDIKKIINRYVMEMQSEKFIISMGGEL